MSELVREAIDEIVRESEKEKTVLNRADAAEAK